MKSPTEPTIDQCTKNERVDFDGHEAFAIWYPQMGGYVAKAVVVRENDDPESCFGVYIWHNGEFPFTADSDNEYKPPYYLHHCSATQFIEFGEKVIEKQTEYFK